MNENSEIEPLSLDDIHKIIEHVFSHLKGRGIKGTGKSPDDFYWQVEADEAFIMLQDPELTVGSLYDDITELRKLINGVDWVTPNELERLAAIFSYLTKVVRSPEN